MLCVSVCVAIVICFCQAEDGIRYLVRSRGLGDVYKRQGYDREFSMLLTEVWSEAHWDDSHIQLPEWTDYRVCLLYTSDAADERSSVDLGGRRILKKKTQDCEAASRVPCNKHSHISCACTFTVKHGK